MCFFFQAEDGIRDIGVTGVQTCALPIWKRHYPVQRIGRRWVVKPRWLDFRPEPEDLVLDLDPGMAFGTGLHPTTQLVLRSEERRVGKECRSRWSPYH